MSAPPVTKEMVRPEMVVGWPEYRKKVTTRAVRMTGPFAVQTSEGLITSE